MDELKVIARICSDFPTKFGIPRQSGLANGLRASIVFEEEYRVPQALRGLEAFSHIWLIWGFSKAKREDWSPTVRPPRLGGNERMGVFATRSPFRPNPIGLSCVELEGVQKHESLGTILVVRGADLMDGTPIYDIKPYLPYTDSRPGASSGFAAAAIPLLTVAGETLLLPVPAEKRAGLLETLAQDPRPHYQDDPNRVYGMEYGGFDVRFTVQGDTLSIVEVVKR